MRLFWSVILSIGLALGPYMSPAVAQPVINAGVQTNDLSRLVAARSTKPLIKGCENKTRQDICFRILVELAPKDGSEVGISGKTDGASAYTATGSVCKGWVQSGADRFDAYDSLRRNWNTNRLTYATSAKPVMIVYQFQCDSSLSTLEEVSIQLNLDFYINARLNGQARYLFNRLELGK